jgi:hypothetical protein
MKKLKMLKILSNIHTIRAHVVGKDERTWLFDDENTDVVPIIDYSEFFVRSNISDKPNLGILFELSMYCRKKVLINTIKLFILL